MGRSAKHAAAPQLVVQPFLDIDFPTTDEDLAALGARNTFAYSVVRPLFVLHRELNGTPGEERQAKVAAFLDRFFGEPDAEFRMQRALEQSKVLFVQGLERYVPEAHRSKLGLAGENGVESVESLIADMFNTVASDEARRRAFVARRRYYFLRFLLHLERSDASLQRSSEATRRAMEILNDRFFVPTDSGEVTLYTQHDPANEGRCLDARTELPLTWQEHRESRVRIRTFRDLDGVERPILVQLRVKDPFAIVVRMLREELHHPEHVPDLRGIRFVCLSHEDRLACLKTLLGRFPIIGSTADDWVDLYSGTAVRQVNRFSSRYFRVLKFSAEFTEALWEFQIMHVHDFANLWYSSGEENWHRYRLRQLFALFFPRFFPRRHFGFRWKKGAMKHAFTEWVLREPRTIPGTTSP